MRTLDIDRALAGVPSPRTDADLRRDLERLVGPIDYSTPRKAPRIPPPTDAERLAKALKAKAAVEERLRHAEARLRAAEAALRRAHAEAQAARRDIEGRLNAATSRAESAERKLHEVRRNIEERVLDREAGNVMRGQWMLAQELFATAKRWQAQSALDMLRRLLPEFLREAERY